MRICAQDEVIFRQSEELSDKEHRAWFRQMLSDFTKYGHGKDFRPMSIGEFRRIYTASQNQELTSPSASLFETPTVKETNGHFASWDGPPRLACERQYQLTEPPRLARISEGGICFLGEHEMPAGEKLYVVHAIRYSTGKARDLWGCEQCANKLLDAYEQIA